MVLTGENIKCLEKNLLECHIFQNKSNMDWPQIEPRPLQWEASNCLSHDTISSEMLVPTYLPTNQVHGISSHEVMSE
jgi:hypothetical protein